MRLAGARLAVGEHACVEAIERGADRLLRDRVVHLGLLGLAVEHGAEEEGAHA